MANIRTKLIHMLGGLTKKECEGDIVIAKINARLEGERRAYQEILNEMNIEYGNPEWGNYIYKFVKCSVEQLTTGDKCQ